MAAAWPGAPPSLPEETAAAAAAIATTAITATATASQGSSAQPAGAWPFPGGLPTPPRSGAGCLSPVPSPALRLAQTPGCCAHSQPLPGKRWPESPPPPGPPNKGHHGLPGYSSPRKTPSMLRGLLTAGKVSPGGKVT